MMQAPQTLLPLDAMAAPIPEPAGDLASLLWVNQGTHGLLTRLVSGPLQPEPVNRQLGDPYVQELDRQIASIFTPMLGLLQGLGAGAMPGQVPLPTGGLNGA